MIGGSLISVSNPCLNAILPTNNIGFDWSFIWWYKTNHAFTSGDVNILCYSRVFDLGNTRAILIILWLRKVL